MKTVEDVEDLEIGHSVARYFVLVSSAGESGTEVSAKAELRVIVEVIVSRLRGNCQKGVELVQGCCGTRRGNQEDLLVNYRVASSIMTRTYLDLPGPGLRRDCN